MIMQEPEPNTPASEGDVSLDEFAIIAKASGVSIGPADLVLMRSGYVALRQMMERLPKNPDPFLEPATVFSPSKRQMR